MMLKHRPANANKTMMLEHNFASSVKAEILEPHILIEKYQVDNVESEIIPTSAGFTKDGGDYFNIWYQSKKS